MGARLGLVFVVVLGACLSVPPAIDDRPGAPTSTPPTRPTAVPVTARAPGATAQSAVEQCPVATGRAQFCEGRKVCTRDRRGCETCRCNTELDSGRAHFEQMNPWDMRQR